jgi:hypothetical protein
MFYLQGVLCFTLTLFLLRSLACLQINPYDVKDETINKTKFFEYNDMQGTTLHNLLHKYCILQSHKEGNVIIIE